MNDEQTSLERRAERHAALADPTRLRIVDLLSLGDLASSELQEQLGVPSNLLAHHVGTLERAGIVARRGSEGDRRRSYLRLERGALPAVHATGGIRARRLLFVCTANSARSQLAAALWGKSSDVPAVSAGTHPADRVDPGAVRVGREHGLEIASATPALVSEVRLDGDLLITVCDNAHEELHASGLHWSIPDPVRSGSPTAFRAAYDDIERRIADLLPQVVAA